MKDFEPNNIPLACHGTLSSQNMEKWKGSRGSRAKAKVCLLVPTLEKVGVAEKEKNLLWKGGHEPWYDSKLKSQAIREVVSHRKGSRVEVKSIEKGKGEEIKIDG
ncbi:hypothetical protein HPP92_019904 [Vanilla planifolia]|uniref:Uncharacterized protein n=1 Tax=Vanilla planifolia TaxID=51239 RepID=A0A835Q3R0_VANPL|nr:hypothetical protein HPP92_019904 [Vanilla planifolia]